MSTNRTPKFEYHEEMTSSGFVFEVFNEHGKRVTEQYISQEEAAFIVKSANNHAALVEVLKIWDRREKLGRKNSGKITREEIAELNKLDLEFPKKARAVLAAVEGK